MTEVCASSHCSPCDTRPLWHRLQTDVSRKFVLSARAQYWVSQAKHWCEYCRIFIGGSKQSIAFHENGKKHKEIVALALKDMRIRGRERRIEKDDMAKEMQKIERAAMKDYLAQDASGMPAPRRDAPVVPADRAARLAELEARITSDRLARASTAASGGVALPPGWRAATNPDGKVYYVHDTTGAMQWDPPGAPPSDGAAAASETGAASSSASAQTQSTAAATGAAHGGWQMGWSEHGVAYYYHTARGVTQWEEPPEWRQSFEAPPPGSHTGDAATGADGALVPASDPGGDASAASGGVDDGPATTADGSLTEAAGSSSGARDADDGGVEESGVDANTGLGAWTVVEEPTKPEGGWDYDGPRQKKARVAWAVNRREEEQEEEEERLEDIKMRFAVPDDMREALARQEAAEAAAEAAAAAAAPAPVFAKRKAGSKAAVRRKPSSAD